MILKGTRRKTNLSFMSRLTKVIRKFKKELVSLQDFVASNQSYWDLLPKRHRIAITVLAFFIFILMIIPTSEPETDTLATEDGYYAVVDDDININNNPWNSSEVFIDQEPHATANGSNLKKEPLAEKESAFWVVHKVTQGDTLASIFRSQKLPLIDLYAITAIEGKDKPLSRIKPGQQLRFKRNEHGKIEMIQIETLNDKKETVVFSRLANDSFARN